MRFKKFSAIIISIIIVIISISIGSVFVSPLDILKIFIFKIFGFDFNIDPLDVGIIWSLRVPRVILAFIVGAVLSVTGAVMQSILKNPLASSHTLGISSGAAFGVGLLVFFKINLNFLGIFTLPLAGLLFGIITVILAVTFSAKMDKQLGNQTIILVGTVFSLFINAMLMILYSMSGETLQKIVYWQMGSVALKDWQFVIILFPIAIIGILFILKYSKELDNLTFGEEAAFIVGVDSIKTKWILLAVSSALTGFCCAIVGIIGFVDLIIPHIVRKIFGSSHVIVIPMSAILGGALLVFADVVARTIISPAELPIGAVTALLGAPFFIYIYYTQKK